LGGWLFGDQKHSLVGHRGFIGGCGGNQAMDGGQNKTHLVATKHIGDWRRKGGASLERSLGGIFKQRK
jgi:hypothetical protein